MADIPTEDAVVGYFSELSNWGRWGDSDTLGTLNYIDDDKRASAARLVRLGRAISCSRVINPGLQDEEVPLPPQRFMITTGQGLGDEHRVLSAGVSKSERRAGVSEFLGMAYHGFRITHLDALSHIFWDQKMYNGVPAELVTSSYGATQHSVTSARHGIITRGVLLDVPRHRGVEWLEPGEYVTPDEAEAILSDISVQLAPGDALLLRTGYDKRRAEKGAERVGEIGAAGWHANCLPWLHRNEVALICSDGTNDVAPSGYVKVKYPIHNVGLVAMGLWLLDNCDLVDLAAACVELGRWEFQYVVSPLQFSGATGSPVNPIAVF